MTNPQRPAKKGQIMMISRHLSPSAIRNVTVIYNRVTRLFFGYKEDILADDDTVKTAKNIARSLKKAGYKVKLFAVDEKTIERMKKLKTDFFFNLCGGIGSLPDSEHEVPKILNTLKIPYSGAESEALLVTTDKIRTKELFSGLNIPTPAYQVFYHGNEDIKLHNFPLIVKPSAKDCSLGVFCDSVVTGQTQLRRKVKELISLYQEPVLVEKYIQGRELNLTLLGNGRRVRVLPISEIIFGKSYANNKWRIVDFEAKWEESSANYKDTVGICPAKINSSLQKKIERDAIRAYQKLCDNPGYARFDVRLSGNHYYFLEINLNPDISDGMGAARSALAGGLNYGEFLKKIISISLTKFKS